MMASPQTCGFYSTLFKTSFIYCPAEGSAMRDPHVTVTRLKQGGGTRLDLQKAVDGLTVLFSKQTRDQNAREDRAEKKRLEKETAESEWTKEARHNKDEFL